MNKEEYKAIHQQLRILYRIDEYEFIKKLEELNFTFFFYRDPHIHIIQKIQDRLNKFRKIPIYIDNRMILPKLSDGFSGIRKKYKRYDNFTNKLVECIL